MKSDWKAGLEEKIGKRSMEGAERRLSAFAPAEDTINLAGNDYLNLAHHTKLKMAASEAIKQYGCSSSASPLLTGYLPVHKHLEKSLCDWYGSPYAMVWNTGYAANHAILSQLPQKGDIVLADRLVHHSMVQGILKSGARLIRYTHCDLVHLEKLLREHRDQGKTVFVVTESVFSMDGDYPDLEHLATLKSMYEFVWILDEAHALGWYGATGSGLAEEKNILPHVDIFVGTLGKALGSMGAFVLLREEILKRYLINYAGEFIYSTYLAPACAASAIAAIEVIQEMGDVRQQQRLRSTALREKLNTLACSVPSGDSPIIPILIKDNDKTVEVAHRLKTQGIYVAAIRPPTVPEGSSRLRISLHAAFSESQEIVFVEALSAALARTP